MKLTIWTIRSIFEKYQDPTQADSIMKVQQELDDTKVVLHKTIEGVLQRGEKLDSLVDKSEALSSSSRMFYKQAKKTNSFVSDYVIIDSSDHKHIFFIN